MTLNNLSTAIPTGGVENDYNLTWTMNGVQYFTLFPVEPGGLVQAYDGQIVHLSLETRYQQLLASQRPPLSPSEFEESIRRSLVMEKLRASITDWLAVSDKELQEEYKRRNDKVKLAVVGFNADSFRPDVSASDQEISSYFEGHQADFRIPEKRS